MKLILSFDKKHLAIGIPDIILQNGDSIESNDIVGIVRYDEKFNCFLDTSKRIYDPTLNFSIFYQGIRFLLLPGMEITLLKRKNKCYTK